MKLEIFLDESKEVISSGSLILENDQIIKFHFPEYNLTYYVKFVKDENTNEPKVIGNVSKDNDSFEILVTNAYLNEYSGNYDNFQVGSVGDKKLFFKYINQHHQQVGRNIFHYRWILE